MTGSDPEGTSPSRWLKIALGPALFLAIELLFHPVLELTPEQALARPDASAEMLRHTLAATFSLVTAIPAVSEGRTDINQTEYQ